MKVHNLKIRGIGRLRDEVSLDFDQLGDARLIAIGGPNGAGKTTFCEAVPGALYLHVPSRGPLSGEAGAKDSLVELEIETDQRYRIQIQIDGVAKQAKQACYLWGEDMIPLVNGKVTTYKTEIAKRFPTRELYLASAFASQGGGERFLDLSQADRKKLFAQMLGLGHLQVLAGQAGEHVKATDAELIRLRERLAGHAELAGDVEEIRQHHKTGEIALGVLWRQIETAKDTLAAARETEKSWTDEHAKLVAGEQASGHAQSRAQDSRTQTDRAMDDAITRHVSLRARIAKAEEQLGDTQRVEVCAAGVGDAEARVAALEAQLAVIQADAAKAHDARLAWVEAGLAVREIASGIEQEWHGRQKNIHHDMVMANHEREASEKSAARLDEVPCGGGGIYAACPLIVSAVECRDSLAAIAVNIAGLKDCYLTCQTEPENLKAARKTLQDLRDNPPAGPPDTADTESCLLVERDALGQARQAAARMEAFATIRDQLDQTRIDLAVAEEDIVKTKTALAVASESLIQAREANGLAELRTRNHAVDKPSSPDGVTLTALRVLETERVKDAATTQERLRQAELAAVDAGLARIDIERATANLDDWKHIKRAFGPQGIQALEIDQAGPDVTALINDLLHSCYGSRFSVSLETTAPLADGSGTKEVFDVRVIDSEQGVEIEARKLSGGEKVLVGEALSLALAIYNSRRSDVGMDDLWRDECAGALYPESAPLYVTMLRKALDLGGFHRCFYVSHNPELWSLADARLNFADGQVSVETT